MKVHCHEENIVQNLKDAGCDKTTIETFMGDLKAENQTKATQLLQKHRCNLLSDLHKDQKRIDCLDYLIFMIQRSKTNNIQN